MSRVFFLAELPFEVAITRDVLVSSKCRGFALGLPAVAQSYANAGGDAQGQFFCSLLERTKNRSRALSLWLNEPEGVQAEPDAARPHKVERL